MNNDLRNGFIANMPIGLSVFTYGSVLGILCVQKGVTLHELIFMNLFIFAGSAQFVMVDMWTSSLDIIGIITAALMINLRYFLIGASLHPLFINSSKTEKFKYMHLVADENWAVTIDKAKRQNITPLFLFGGGLCLLFVWSLGTTGGFLLGEFIKNPADYGLDFAFVAIFTALCVNMYQGGKDILPWMIAALFSVTCEYLFPGKIYIIAGALAGSLSALYLNKEEET